MGLERDLEERSVEKVLAAGGRALKLVLLGIRGFPDRTILLPGGRVFFVEFKREKKNAGLAAAQQEWRRILTQLGFRVYAINNDNDFDAVLEAELAA